MTADVAITVMGRLGWASRVARIEISGPIAIEGAIRFGREKPGLGSPTSRSYPTLSVIDEVLGMLPPRSDFHACDVETVRAAWEALNVFATVPNGVAASYAKSMLRWQSIPECVSSLQQFVGAEFVVTTEGPAGRANRWWVSGDAGWVGLELSGAEVSLVPSSVADIRYDLLVDLVDAMTARSD